MACNTGCGGKRATIQYEVNFGVANQPSQKYDTATEAQNAIRAAGNPAGSSYRAVQK